MKIKGGILTIAAIVEGIIILSYLCVAIYFMGHFYNHTIINDIDVSYKNINEVKELTKEKVNEYKLLIIGRNDVTDYIDADSISLAPDFDGEFEEILKSQNALLWPVCYLKDSEYKIDTLSSYSEEEFDKKIDTLAFFSNENIIEPKDAYVSDTWDDEGYYIVPAEDGSKPIKAEIKNCISEALGLMSEEVILSESCYEKAKIQADDEKLVSEISSLNKYYKANIYYEFGDETIYVRDYITDWIDEKNDNLDKEKVREFVNSLSRKYDTFGISRQFKTHTGEVITVKGGTYGWWMNRPQETEDLISAIMNGESGKRTPVYYSTAAQYGDNDIGSTYIEADLTEQHIWVYENGEAIIDSDFVSGNISKGHGTHTGVYGITYKERNATLQGQGYSSPVSYWMPFNENEGLHDASWRSEFGGDLYLRNGSHGCINLPSKVAEKIYEVVYKDEPVVVYGGKTEVPAEELTPEQQLALLIQAGLLNPDGSVPEGSDVIEGQ